MSKRINSFAKGILFSCVLAGTGGMLKAQTVQIGSGGATNDYIPNYYLYEKSYNQTIYSHDELVNAGMDPQAGLITKIRYKPTSSVSTATWRDWTVYLGNTSQDGFADGDDWISIGSLTEVFDGQIPANTTANSWMEITLDTPFQWDGTSNIVVAVNQTTDDWGGSTQWASYSLTPSSGSKAIYKYRDGPDYDPANPPSGLTTDDVAQIQFDGNLMGPCSGTPDPGTISGNSTFGICSGETLMLTVTGGDLEGGITYQWQQRVPYGTGVWTDIPNANSLNLNLTNGISDTTDFRLIVTCSNTGDLDSTDIVTATLNNYLDCYCIPLYSSGCGFGDRISGFSLSGDNGTSINNNNSDCSPASYGDFTNLPAVDLYVDSTYNGTVTTDYSSPEYESVRIWIDLNNSGTFESAEIIASFSGMSSGGDNFTFTVPSAYLGPHRMRVRLVYTDDASVIDPCSSASYGETEDYMVNILSNATCFSPIDFQEINVGIDSVELSWVDIGNASAWNIEYGPSGYTPGTGTLITGVSTNPYTVSGLNHSTDYDFYIQSDCGSGDSSSWSGPLTVTTECGANIVLNLCESFEVIENLGCWEMIDNNSDGESWAIYEGVDFSGNSVANTGELAAGISTNNSSNDDYFVLPQMTLTGNEVMSYFYRVALTANPNNYNVVLSTTGSDPADFVNILLSDTINNEPYKDTLIDLSAFTGNVYIAFHVPAGALPGSYILIDDICLDICTPTPGTDGEINVCRTEGTVDLDSVVTQAYSHGKWSFPANPGILNGSTFNFSTLASGEYEAYYIVETLCTKDTTFASVNVYAVSSAGEGGTIEVCKGEPINLFSALSGNVDMGGSWYDYSNILLSNSQPKAPSIEASYNYLYVTSNGICPADTAIVEVIVIGDCDLSITEELFDGISVYPNPATNLLKITNSSNISALEIEMFDMNGRIVMSDNKALKNASEVSLDVRSLETGVYTLRIYNEKGQKMFKVIKQ